MYVVMFVCTYVRMYVCMSACMYVCMHVFPGQHCLYTFRIYIYTKTHTYVHTYVHTYIHACIHPHIHLNIQTHMYVFNNRSCSRAPTLPPGTLWSFSNEVAGHGLRPERSLKKMQPSRKRQSGQLFLACCSAFRWPTTG